MPDERRRPQILHFCHARGRIGYVGALFAEFNIRLGRTPQRAFVHHDNRERDDREREGGRGGEDVAESATMSALAVDVTSSWSSDEVGPRRLASRMAASGATVMAAINWRSDRKSGAETERSPTID